MIRVSAGTAHVLGFRNINTDVLPTTAYLMTGSRCIHSCGFCPQSQNSSSRPDLLSRVTWQAADIEDVAKSVEGAFALGQIKRVCLQAVSGRETLAELNHITTIIKRFSDIPLCISVRPKNQGELEFLAGLRVDRLTIALDAATPHVFRRVKGGSWEKTVDLLTAAAKLLPGRVSTHLIAGLGETEEEMVNTFQRLLDMGIMTGLFAFTPVPGTKMASAGPPALESYRRLQAALYFIYRGLTRTARCRFVSGHLTSLGLNRIDLQDNLANGQAFETSGCPDCNRPYYNEKPGGVIYNYPRKLTPGEIEAAINTVLDSLETED